MGARGDELSEEKLLLRQPYNKRGKKKRMWYTKREYYYQTKGQWSVIRLSE